MFRASAAAALVSVLVKPASDGNWCGEKGLHLTIKGPEITTPSGVNLKGNYHRHEFTYVAPPGDAKPGMLIYLMQLSEELMNLYHVKVGKPRELRRRCEVTS
jgi:hypothetical protein